MPIWLSSNSDLRKLAHRKYVSQDLARKGVKHPRELICNPLARLLLGLTIEGWWAPFLFRAKPFTQIQWRAELARPRLLADFEAQLRKIGKWEGLPKRADFKTESLFAAALERHCDLEPGSVLEGRVGWITLKPEAGLWLTRGEVEAKLSCLRTVIKYAAAYDPSLKFGFIGNEKIASEQ